MLALGQLLVILTRGIDLSVGSVVGLAGVRRGAAAAAAARARLAVFARHRRSPSGSSTARCSSTGRVMNPFIVTLGTLEHRPRRSRWWSPTRRPRPGCRRSSSTLGTGTLGRLPVPVLLVAALALARRRRCSARTQWGRWIYAVGGNPEAARRAGIPVDRVLLSVYVLCGLAAGIAGDPRRRAARTPARRQAGQLLELDAITAVIIGGASFFGGRGRVGNVIAGALIIGVIRNGLDLLGRQPVLAADRHRRRS